MLVVLVPRLSTPPPSPPLHPPLHFCFSFTPVPQANGAPVFESGAVLCSPSKQRSNMITLTTSYLAQWAMRCVVHHVPRTKGAQRYPHQCGVLSVSASPHPGPPPLHFSLSLSLLLFPCSRYPLPSFAAIQRPARHFFINVFAFIFFLLLGVGEKLREGCTCANPNRRAFRPRAFKKIYIRTSALLFQQLPRDLDRPR